MLDIPVILLVFWLAFRSNKRIADSFGPLYAEWYHKQLNNLLIYHSIFSFLFPLLPGDAIGYWNYGFQQLIVHSDNMSDYFGIGTVFLLWLDPGKDHGAFFYDGQFIVWVGGVPGAEVLVFAVCWFFKIQHQSHGRLGSPLAVLFAQYEFLDFRSG
jgi:hypothetical protein